MHHSKNIQTFQKTILEWFAENGRHDLPWRPPALKLRRDGMYDPYKILVSEIMLQQTQVDRVREKYTEFIKHFATLRKLAEASPADVLAVWKGLGYNRRALYLKRAAEKITHEHKGRFPRDVVDIQKLPGVGHYTARAVAVFAFNQPHVFIETNIRRVFIHFFGDVIPAKAGTQTKIIHGLDPGTTGITISLSSRSHLEIGNLRRDDTTDKGGINDKELMPYIEKALYKKEPRLWYSALMDYGALALSDIPNPNKRSRHYTKQSRFEGSRRYARAKILDFLLKNKSVSLPQLQEFFQTDIYLDAYIEKLVLLSILTDLTKEGFLSKKSSHWSLITNPLSFP